MRLIVIYSNKAPTFTSDQIDKLADILIAFGQIAFGSATIPFLLPNLDASKIPVLLLGVITTFSSWILAVYIVR